MKAADRLVQPSLLSMRLKADWDQATPMYEQAALNYKVNQTVAASSAAACRFVPANLQILVPPARAAQPPWKFSI